MFVLAAALTLENGVRQDTTVFSRDASAQHDGPLPAPGPGTNDERGRRRVFLILIGAGHLEGPIKPFEGAAEFIRRRLSAQELVSLMAFNRLTEPTTDHERVASIVERLKRDQDRVRTELLLLALNTRRQQVDITPAIQAHIDDLFQPAGGRTPVRSATAALLGKAQFRRDQQDRWRPWERIVAHSDLLRIYAGIEYLRAFPGEKHLVCLIRGFGLGVPRWIQGAAPIQRLDDRRDEAALAARANDAGVALDIIHTYGVPPGAVQIEILSSQNLANLTGGQFSGLRTADEQLARIDDATRNGYVLGYVPANPALDGKYRNIRVEVNRKGVTLIYGRGYTAQPDPPPIDPADLLTRERLREAAGSTLALTDIKVKAKASVVSEAGQRQARVEIAIDPAELGLTDANGRWEGGIDLMVLVGDERQQVVGRLDQHMKVSMTPALYQRARTEGIPYTAIVPLSGPARHVKVIVYDFASDRVGTAAIVVK
jgi:hypothetical protein